MAIRHAVAARSPQAQRSCLEVCTATSADGEKGQRAVRTSRIACRANVSYKSFSVALGHGTFFRHAIVFTLATSFSHRRRGHART